MIKPNKITSKIFSYLLLILFSIIYISPVIIAVLNSFKTKGEIIASPVALPTKFSFDNYVSVITDSSFFSAFMHSAVITIVTTLCIVLLSSLAGYGIARWNSKWSNFFMMFFLISMFIPFEAYMISLVKTAFSLKLTGLPIGLIIVYIGLGVPTPIFLFRGFVKSLPYEVEEAAIIDGCNPIQRFFYIVFPLLKPIAATVSVLNFMWIWNDFLLPSLILNKPLTIPLSQVSFFGEHNQQWHLIMANFVISSTPAIIFFLVMQKSVVKGLASGAVKS